MATKKKLICIRIDDDLMSKIDYFACTNRRYNRTFVITQLLDVLLSCTEPLNISRMLGSYDAYSQGYKITFSK